jgi:hypothetical protein
VRFAEQVVKKNKKERRIMQCIGNTPKYKIEFEAFPNGDLEIRYFNNPDDTSYYSWRLPEKVVEKLVSWWKKLRENRNIQFPVKEKTENCEFVMHTGKSVDIREIDSLGRYKTKGWTLPIVVVEELVNCHGKE